jgi:broad specificity phosphatase PhoE
VKVILMRHGEILLPDERKRYIGQSDCPMTEDGKRQVERKLAAMKKEFPILAGICSSDLLRCVQTAKAAARCYDMSFEKDKRLREIHMGSWEGLLIDAVRERYPEDYEERGKDPGIFCPPGGESFQMVADRVWEALAFWGRTFGQEAPLLVITHAGVIKTMKCKAQREELNQVFRYRIGYGEYMTMEYPADFH